MMTCSESNYIMALLKDEMKSRLSEELAAPLRVMRDTARRIARVCIEAKMDVDEEQYVQSFKTGLMDVVYAWAKVWNYKISTDNYICRI